MVPQPPQLVSVLSAVSQPLRVLASQLPQPLLQTGAHALAAQLVVPWALVHAVPQLPQFDTLLASATSQPLATLASQLAKPELQLAMPHALLAHRGVPFAVVQVLLQKPQSATVFVRLVSQSAAFVSQSPRPAGHIETWQAWLAQTWNDVSHVSPQPPQLFGSVAMLVSQPLTGLPSQSEKPAAHTGVHALATQLVVPFAFEQTVPQLPQACTAVRRSVSQPFWTLPSQSPAVPGAQTGVQTPCEHEVLPSAVVHADVQPPQLITSLAVAVSQPF